MLLKINLLINYSSLFMDFNCRLELYFFVGGASNRSGFHNVMTAIPSVVPIHRKTLKASLLHLDPLF